MWPVRSPSIMKTSHSIQLNTNCPIRMDGLHVAVCKKPFGFQQKTGKNIKK